MKYNVLDERRNSKNDMKTKQILQYVALIGSALAIGAEALAVLWQYESGTNYFHSGAILPLVAVVAAIIAAIAGTALACTAKCDRETTEIFSDGRQYASILTTVGFALAAALLAIYFAKTALSGVAMLTLLTSIAAAFYALATCIPSLRAQTNAISLIGFFAPIACILWNAYYYFDATIEMNSPIKTATQIGLLCAMLYFLSELRFLMGQPLPRMFLATAYWVRAFGALSSIAVPIAYITGQCDRLDYVAGALLTFCVMLAAGFRIRTLLKFVQE